MAAPFNVLHVTHLLLAKMYTSGFTNVYLSFSNADKVAGPSAYAKGMSASQNEVCLPDKSASQNELNVKEHFLLYK